MAILCSKKKGGENMCLKRRSEFRTNNSNKGRGHPSYIYKKIGDEYFFIGITHSPITANMKNIKLDKNPNPSDKEDSYFRPFATKDKTYRFGKKKKGWKLSKKDKKKTKMIRKTFKD